MTILLWQFFDLIPWLVSIQYFQTPSALILSDCFRSDAFYYSKKQFLIIKGSWFFNRLEYLMMEHFRLVMDILFSKSCDIRYFVWFDLKFVLQSIRSLGSCWLARVHVVDPCEKFNFILSDLLKSLFMWVTTFQLIILFGHILHWSSTIVCCRNSWFSCPSLGFS